MGPVRRRLRARGPAHEPGTGPRRRRGAWDDGLGLMVQAGRKPLVVFVDRAGAQSIWSLVDRIRTALDDEGVAVHTCHWDEGGARRWDWAGTAERDHRIAVPARRRPWDVLRQHAVFAPAFRRLLDDLAPDVVHANFIVPGGSAMRLARRAGVPRVVVTRHELYGSLSAHLRAWTRLAERAADHVVYVSQTVAASYGAPNAPVYDGRSAPPARLVIRNGVDTGALAKVAPWPRGDSQAPFVVPGRLVPAKGHATAIAALGRVAARDPAARLEVIGDGPERARLAAVARAHGVAERVDFLGRRPRGETLARMKSARGVVVPSGGRQEGYGLVLAEALALGAPVVATEIRVFREVAPCGAGVAFFPPGDADALAAHLLDPPAPARADLAPDDATMCARYLALYRYLLTST